jgi:hypothetical protein
VPCIRSHDEKNAQSFVYRMTSEDNGIQAEVGQSRCFVARCTCEEVQANMRLAYCMLCSRGKH